MLNAKVQYYITTAIVSLMMVFAAIQYFYHPKLAAAFNHLGFPAYFRIELAVGKLIGVALLWLPVPSWIKEWTYGVFSIVFFSAFIAHTVSGDPVIARIVPLFFLSLHLISYYRYRVITYRDASLS